MMNKKNKKKVINVISGSYKIKEMPKPIVYCLYRCEKCEM